MIENICQIEITKENEMFKATLYMEHGIISEYINNDIEDMMISLTNDLHDAVD